MNNQLDNRLLKTRWSRTVYYDRTQANQLPRYEPREAWPRGSRCAKPLAPVDGEPGVHVELDVRFHAGRKHLPIVSIKRAA